MKQRFMILLVCVLCLAWAFPAMAQENPEAAEVQTDTAADLDLSETQAQNASQPRLMVSEYHCGILTPDQESTVEIVFKNYSSTKAVYNIKLSAADESGDIRPAGVGTNYVDRIKAGGTYTWKLPVTVAKTATQGEHKLSVAAEYEDEYYTAYSSADTLPVTVMQSVSLDYSGLALPQNVTQGQTASMDVSFMNTGKSAIRNCTVQFEISGLQTGGVLFIGEIPAGESLDGTANFNVSKDMLGETSGTATIRYEDELGNSYSETADLSTVIKEPPPQEAQNDSEKDTKYPLWWLFLLIGVAAGGAAGFAIPTAVHARKQRLEDEKRL